MTEAPRPPIRTAGKDDAPEPLLAGTRRDMPARVLPHRDKPAEDWAASSDRVPVFVTTDADGEQTVYSMPAKPHPGIMFGFMRDMDKRGDVALIPLLERVLDPGAVDAMQEELAAMEPDDASAFLSSISERVQRNLSGGMKR